MKILINEYFLYLFMIYFFLFVIQFSNSLFLDYNDIVTSIKLSNGNFLLLSEYCKYYIIDPTFTKIINEIDIEDCGFDADCDNNKIIYFSKEDGEYILYYICSIIDIFSKEGYFLSQHSISSYSSNSIIPYGHEESNLIFYYIYAKNNITIVFNKYSYNLLSNQLSNNKNNEIEIKYIYNSIITCQLIEYLNKNVISCFHQTSDCCINLTFFDVENDFTIIKSIYTPIDINNKIIYSISTVMKGKENQKILSVFLDDNNNLFYIGYNNTDLLVFNRNFMNDNNCNYYSNFFYLSYFEETNEFIFSSIFRICFSYDCYSSCQNYYFIYSFDIDFNINFTGIINNYFLIGEACNTYKLFHYSFDNYHYIKNIYFSSLIKRYFLIQIFLKVKIIYNYIFFLEEYI